MAATKTNMESGQLGFFNMLGLSKFIPTTISRGVSTMALVAILALTACSKSRPENPENADRDALAKLAEEFAHTSIHPAAQVPFIDPVSLAKYMVAHRALLSQWDIYGPDGKLDEFFIFPSGLATTLDQTIPEKYYSSFSIKTPLVLPGDFRDARISAISIEKERAYVVLELPPEKDSGFSRPEYHVQPTVRAKSGWKMDVSSTLV